MDIGIIFILRPQRLPAITLKNSLYVFENFGATSCTYDNLPHCYYVVFSVCLCVGHQTDKDFLQDA